jgi:hypothetical protein
VRLLRLPHHPHCGLLRGHGYWKRLGPGIVTGAADDDPSGIGTYSQVGAAFGFGLLWTTLATLPLAIAVPEATARLGLVTAACGASTRVIVSPSIVAYGLGYATGQVSGLVPGRGGCGRPRSRWAA